MEVVTSIPTPRTRHTNLTRDCFPKNYVEINDNSFDCVRFNCNLKQWCSLKKRKFCVCTEHKYGGAGRRGSNAT